MVSTTVENSIKYVRDYVRCYMSDHIGAAKERISSYGTQYTEIMTAALNAKAQSASAAWHGCNQFLACGERSLDACAA